MPASAGKAPRTYAYARSRTGLSGAGSGLAGRGLRAAVEDMQADAGGGGELAGITGEAGPARRSGRLRVAGRFGRGVLAGALLQHRLDLPDVDHAEFQRRRARLAGRGVAVGTG